ncbi:MAG: Ppx/GppA family phosphatase [Kofleriaceae bacterium]|nr:Ppx/GppA family phosphatase [Kofleriaceae bacterium]
MTTMLGAIDAGSNAIRVVIARQDGETLDRVEAERVAVRLGRGAFTRGELDPATIDEAVGAFRHFRERFDHFGVSTYRAVATSAVRDASNRDVLLHRLYHEAGIELEIIDGTEEARLVRKAVTTIFLGKPQPKCILDLGGGSLEINVRQGSAWRGTSLPIGTVRLIESFGITGAMNDAEAGMVRRYAATLLQTIGRQPDVGIAAVTGGNADALAKILGDTLASSTSGSFVTTPGFELAALERALPSITEAGIEQRMALFNVRRDRAEVLGVAALVFATVGRQLGITRFLAPGVGVREAVLIELAETVREAKAKTDNATDKALLTAARAFANRVDHDTTHGDQVRRLARQLFEQLRDIHQLGPEYCVLLEVAAILHDIGEVVSPRGHHKHSEYMIRWGRLPGLGDIEREIVALSVRCHRKSAADCRKLINEAPLTKEQRTTTRRLAALLRVADGIDSEHRRRVTDIVATRMGNVVVLDLIVRDGPTRDDAQLTRKADLFRDEFGVELRITVGRAATLPPTESDIVGNSPANDSGSGSAGHPLQRRQLR